MDKDLVFPFLQAMKKVLSTMAMLDSTPSDLATRVECPRLLDITGWITLDAPGLSGTLAISFPSRVILAITHRMLGEELADINETVSDLVGEITNMVTGSAKQALQTQGYDFAMARPTVSCGQDSSRLAGENDATVISFDSSCGNFLLAMAFERQSQGT